MSRAVNVDAPSAVDDERPLALARPTPLHCCAATSATSTTDSANTGSRIIDGSDGKVIDARPPRRHSSMPNGNNVNTCTIVQYGHNFLK